MSPEWEDAISTLAAVSAWFRLPAVPLATLPVLTLV
jgi:hypothetical protein